MGASWEIDDYSSCERLTGFDAIVLSAGSGLFLDSILEKNDFPIQLVGGQSIEFGLKKKYPNEAVLCGKYIVPLPESQNVLVGATHEFGPEPFSETKVKEELLKRSRTLSPFVWEHGKILKITQGYRVQSRRTHFGRMPIIRRLQNHPNTWVFTGLSNRGLVYHGLYGDLLSTAILQNSSDINNTNYPETSWWK